MVYGVTIAPRPAKTAPRKQLLGLQLEGNSLLMLEPQILASAAEFVAPARINLLGEHTDYTGGFVMPMAIPFATIASISSSPDDLYHVSSSTFPKIFHFTRDDRSDAIRSWVDYPIGVLRQLQALGIEPPPFSLHLRGDIPLGSGLSSSASVEVATALALLSISERTLRPEQIALLCQTAENQFVKSPCGIMDQFVITAAKAGHALLLNTRTLEYEHLPMNTGDLAGTRIVICNSMVKHSIAAGEYGDRRREVEVGQAILREQYPGLIDLAEASLQQLEACRTLMPPESFLRCRHIISENARVLEARQAMFAGDPVHMGRLVTAAHISERDDFACSCEEVDFLVETAIGLDGCYGARLSGGGFGGCTVNLVQQNHAQAFTEQIKLAYHERYQIAADIFVCEAVDGAWIRTANMECAK